MILTEKARKDFEYKFNMSNFNELDEYLQLCRILSFFDFAGIYIDIPVLINDFDKVQFGCMVNDEIQYSESDTRAFDDRQNAMKFGVKKANEIYNKN